MRGFRSDPNFFQWNAIKRFAGNDLSRFVTAIPIVGYMIVFNDQFVSAVSYHKLAGSTEGPESLFFLGSLLKLRLVFFGSVFVAVAHIAYVILRPQVLAHSNNEFEFSDRVLGTYTRTELVSIEKDMNAPGRVFRTPFIVNDEIYGFQRKIQKKQLAAYNPNVDLRAKETDYIRALAREWYAGEMHRYRIVRWSAVCFAFFGYALLVVPTLDLFQAVLRGVLS